MKIMKKIKESEAYQEMQRLKAFQEVKTVDIDLKDIETSLKQHDLIDDRLLWFAGYDDTAHVTQNAIAANLLYGKKRYVIISLSGTTLYRSRNSKKGFVVSRIGDTSYKIRMSRMGIWHPHVELVGFEDHTHYIKVMENKQILKSFKQAL